MKTFSPIACLCRCAYYLQIHRLRRYLNKNKIIILMYHGFTDKKKHEGIENSNGLHLNIEKFKSQIEYLKRYYNIISLDQLIGYYNNSAKIPLNSVVITIDDGYKSNYTLAYPVLKGLDAPAAIFVTADFINKKKMLWIDRIEYAINMTKAERLELKIDKNVLSFDLLGDNLKELHCREIGTMLKSIPQELREDITEDLERDLGQRLSCEKNIPDIYQPLEWADVLEMSKSGIISIGSHTCSHIILTRCNSEDMEKELFLSKQAIEKITGAGCKFFCYPNGGIGDFDYITKKALKESGYSCGLTTIAGMNDGRSDVFELKRLSVDNRDDMVVFIMKLCGALKSILELRQFILGLFSKKE